MKVGPLIQMLSLEMSTACNLGKLHTKCPNTLGLERYAGLSRARRLTEADIIRIARWFAQDGFTGLYNFSSYNEPLMDQPKLWRLVDNIRAVVPAAKFNLITNGMYLPDDLEPFRVFSYIGVTDYGGDLSPDPDKIARLTALVGPPTKRPPRGVWVTSHELDQRMALYGRDRSGKGCLYPFKEIVIDAFGNMHICCFDWEGKAGLGNVLEEGLETCLERWRQTVWAVTAPQMLPGAPDSCRHCRARNFNKLTDLDMDARRRAKLWLRENPR